MAQNLILNILAKDKTRQAFAGVRSGLANLKSAVFSVQSALVGIGGVNRSMIFGTACQLPDGQLIEDPTK